MPITILDYVAYKLGYRARYPVEIFDQLHVPMIGSCASCGLTILAHNAYPSHTGYLCCRGCIGDSGFVHPAEFGIWVHGALADYDHDRGAFGALYLPDGRLRTDGQPTPPIAVPGPELRVTDPPCDADARGTETATQLIQTPRGPLQLCDHHAGLHELAFVACEYIAVPIMPDDEAVINSRPYWDGSLGGSL